MKFLLLVTLIACAARCSGASSGPALRKDHAKLAKLQLKGLKEQPHYISGEPLRLFSTREEDLNYTSGHWADWNFNQLRDAPHHQRRVKSMQGTEYDLHWYETEMGNVTHGDILLDPKFLDYVLSHDGQEPPEVHLMGAPDTQTRTFWDCPIPYVISGGLPDARRVTDAVAHIERFTRWRFQQVSSTSADHMVFQSSTGCSSFIGRIGGGQTINLATGCETAAAVHEILHAIGIYHEQSRPDRDNFVQINTQNIQSGAGNNFDLSQNIDTSTAYDYGSLMHYGVNDFSVNGQPTITSRQSIPASSCTQIGQRLAMSESDVQAAMYRFQGVSAGSSCGTDISPPAWNEGCPAAGSVRLCGHSAGASSTYNGVYEPTGTSGGRTSYIRMPWNWQERYMFYSGSRWCVGTSIGSCTNAVAASNGDEATPDLATWTTANVGVTACGSPNTVKHFCEKAPASIQCPAGETITVKSAAYGRQANETSRCAPTSNDPGPAGCGPDDVTAKIEQLCDGATICDFTPSNALFGGNDPCPGTSKYLTVEYTC